MVTSTTVPTTASTGALETRGIEPVPAGERTGRPGRLPRGTWFGENGLARVITCVVAAGGCAALGGARVGSRAAS